MADDIPTLIANVSDLISSTEDLTETAALAAASRTIFGTTSPPDPSLGSNGNLYVDTVAEMEYGPKTAGSWGAGRSRVGPAGGNVAAVGPASGMVSSPSATVIPDGTTVIRTSDVGNPSWRYSASAASLAATIPGAIVYDSTSRGFILDELILTPEMFGAKGDGATNDTTAMQQLSAFVNWRGHGIISFRAGATYIVGRQTTALGTGPAYTPQQVLNFTGVDGLLILGHGAHIQNAAGLHYGSFDPSTGLRYDPPPGGFSTATYSAAIGHILQGTNCTRVAIQDLRIDGNNANVTLGGYYGDKGYQIPGDCMRFTTSSFIKLDNLQLVNAPHDNLYLNINGNVADQVSDMLGQFQADNVLCDLAGRQGCSITGGSGLTFRNCGFNRSGQGRIHSPPMAGCDVEPVSRWASDIVFENCHFDANGGVGLINDSGQTDRVLVKGCTMWGGFLAANSGGSLTQDCGHALLVGHGGWTIEDCRIHGTQSQTFTGTIYSRCLFDNATHATYGLSACDQAGLWANTTGAILLDCRMETYAGTTNSLFSPPPDFCDRCTFVTGNSLGANLGAGVFRDCQFTSSLTDYSTYSQYGLGGLQPIFLGRCAVSGPTSVGNFKSGDLPAYAPYVNQVAYQPIGVVNALTPITQDYRAALPTTGYFRAGAKIFNSANASGTPGYWECTTAGGVATASWAASTAYRLNDFVINGGNSYICNIAGVSAGSGGPTGTGGAITDGTARWSYVPAAVWTPRDFDVPGVTAVAAGASAASITAASTNTQRWNDALAGNKTATISTAGVIPGRRYRFVRTAAATGAFTLSIIYNSVTLQTLDAGEWCEVEYSAADSAFVLIGYGTGV